MPGPRSLLRLPPHMQPRTWRHAFGGALRNAMAKTELWVHGSGAWEASKIGEDLCLRPDGRNTEHGFVEPSRPMLLADYRRAIVETRSAWSLVPPEEHA